MKKIILSMVVALLVTTTEAQQENRQNNQSEQLKNLQEIEELADLRAKDQRFVALYNANPNANFGFLPFTLGREFAGLGNEEKMKFYADIASKSATDGKGNPIAKESIYASMAMGMVQINPDAAALYLKYGVNESKASLDKMLTEASPNENLLQRAKNNYFSVLSSYLYALSNGTNAEKAFALAKETYDNYKQDPKADGRLKKSLERVYTHALVKTKRYSEALPLLEAGIKEGETSKSTLDNLKTAYLEVKGSNADYATYEAKLLATQKQTLKDEIAKMAINQVAYNFKLKDLHGNIVNLSDYKGKVVVLDFWATWCGPCKASFPAMQKAVNKYKKDSNVQFLFLHTWEKGGGDPTQNAEKYITDNNYSFKVLMDLRDPKTNASAVASAFKVSGIPAKFIIDPKGNIRFNTSGFSADEDKAVEELSNMIEFAKKG
ncbi:hypothetical protein GCM10009120_49820 [Sphingobacterium siyangense subsp. cladoniae]|uniref:TlpA family protein disulfide reductase n=1 Tax=Sphingobacterium siyangense TaxID=459529 RepID=UPI0031F96384